MGNVEKKLKELGIELPECPKPVAAYVPATCENGFIFASGQTAWVDGKLLYPGKVGEAVSVEEAYESAKISAVRVIAELKSIVGDLDNIKHIVKVTGYVNSAPDFGAQPKVVNGASELFCEVFGEAGKHARVAFGVGALPDNASVEIDVIAAI